MYFYIPNLRNVLIKEIFDVLFHWNILSSVSFSPFFYKTMQKILNSGGQVVSLKWGEKNLNNFSKMGYL